MVEVKLVGYNGDLESLKNGREFTPETISAAYARISRDSRDISELRKNSRKEVEMARKSNINIVFGLGHHSVAEHAIFNFDIVGISRLALEELEERRIGGGYTEKSQRYVKMDGEYHLPKEFEKNIYDQHRFKKLVEIQNLFYSSNISMLEKYWTKKFPDLSSKLIEGKAKEDARYSLGLATKGQVGVSFNGRALEHAIRTMKHSNLAEVREISDTLYEETKKVAPSLIILSDAEEFEKQFGVPLKEDYFKYGGKNLEKICNDAHKMNLGVSKDIEDYFCEGDVKLVGCGNVDKEVIAALIHSNSNIGIGEAYSVAENLLKGRNKRGASEFMKESLKYVSEFDSLPREFEFGGDLKYEIVLSASNFAQLKRHRIMTLLKQNYDDSLGYTIPDSIKKSGVEKDFERVCNSSGDLFEEFKEKYGDAAQYVLTNAHRRKVLVSINPRELYHISRLREDEHAQWDIRKTAEDMLILAKKVAPITFMLSGGKSDFEKIHKEIYGDENA